MTTSTDETPVTRHQLRQQLAYVLTSVINRDPESTDAQRAHLVLTHLDLLDGGSGLHPETLRELQQAEALLRSAGQRENLRAAKGG